MAVEMALALTCGTHGCDDDDHDDDDGSWSDEEGGAGVVAIEHVTVLPTTRDDEELVDATVLIANGRIGAIGPAGEVELPSSVRRVDGSEKWLMPALADSHVHVENERLMRFLLADPDVPEGSVDASRSSCAGVCSGATTSTRCSRTCPRATPPGDAFP